MYANHTDMVPKPLWCAKQICLTNYIVAHELSTPKLRKRTESAQKTEIQNAKKTLLFKCDKHLHSPNKIAAYLFFCDRIITYD